MFDISKLDIHTQIDIYFTAYFAICHDGEF